MKKINLFIILFLCIILSLYCLIVYLEFQEIKSERDSYRSAYYELREKYELKYFHFHHLEWYNYTKDYSPCTWINYGYYCNGELIKVRVGEEHTELEYSPLDYQNTTWLWGWNFGKDGCENCIEYREEIKSKLKEMKE